MDILVINTDGGARGNPGPAGIGVVVKKNGTTIAEISRFIGNATNNVAEYIAVIYGLQEAIILRSKNIELRLDSQLVARQMKREYRIKNKDLKKFADITLNLLRCFDKVNIVEIPREDNAEADGLVNKAINLLL